MRKGRKLIAVLTVLCLLTSFSGLGWAAGSVTVEQAIDSTCQVVLNKITSPGINDNWYVMDLARANYSVPAGYYQGYFEQVAAELQKANGVLNVNDSGEYSKTILALTACGFDVTNVGGYNLLKTIADFDYVKKIGTMGPTWALIALDSYHYAIPEAESGKKQVTREKLITDLLARELPSGGFKLCSQISEGVYDLSGSVDIDVTAMVIQALAPYQHIPEVKSATDRALQVLSEKQLATGDYKYYGVQNCESSVQVLVMLSSLGIDAQKDSRFIKTDAEGTHNLLEVVNSYYLEGGGYEHTAGGGLNWSYACNQGLYAMLAYQRLTNNQNSLYDMTDVSGITAEQVDLKSVSLTAAAAPTTSTETPVETSPTAPVAPITEEPQEDLYTDIASHWAKNLINTYKGLGIARGLTTEFKPDQAITRAEFCVAMVNAFGLSVDGNNRVTFGDVSQDAWYYNHILKAASQGIINGKGDGNFAPEATITRQEAMVITQNLAQKYNLAAAAVDESVFSNYTDSDQVSAWAKPAVLYNLNNQIIVGSQGKIAPLNNITRAETIAVVNNLLGKLSLTSQY